MCCVALCYAPFGSCRMPSLFQNSAVLGNEQSAAEPLCSDPSNIGNLDLVLRNSGLHFMYFCSHYSKENFGGRPDAMREFPKLSRKVRSNCRTTEPVVGYKMSWSKVDKMECKWHQNKWTLQTRTLWNIIPARYLLYMRLPCLAPVAN